MDDLLNEKEIDPIGTYQDIRKVYLAKVEASLWVSYSPSVVVRHRRMLLPKEA